MAGSTRQSREMKKWIAARRAQYALQQKLDRIDHEEDVILPEAEALLSGKVKLEIESTNEAAAASIINVTVRREVAELTAGDDDDDDPDDWGDGEG